MSTLATTLKNEIRRLARKEVKTEIAASKKTSSKHRKEIVSLKRQLSEQKRELASLQRQFRKTRSADAGSVKTTARFSPAWVKAHRERLGLSAADYGTLVGVSALTIYNWEKGKTRPRQQQLGAWSLVRQLGKREAWRRLEGVE